MKIALIHDYLAQEGGAEQVLRVFHEIWPTAPIFVLFHDRKKIAGFEEAQIRESFLAKFPFIKSNFQWYLPLMPLATEKYNLGEFDIVLSSTSAFAKGVITAPHTLHVSYCHTPARYLWSDTHHYVADLQYNSLVKTILPRFMSKIRLWDKMSADRVDYFIANSRTVQNRIQKYYRRDSTVIHPPVNTNDFFVSEQIGNYFVAGGRLVPYKHTDLIIQAFNRLKLPLKIFGTGPELKKLRQMAKPNIEFLGQISNQEKASLLSNAQAFIHPQVEDFGITALETMASGRPVIAFAEGGATETVLAGETGLFFYEQSWEAILDTILNFNGGAWDSNRIREHAGGFSVNRFKDEITRHVSHRYEEFKRGFKQPSLIETYAYRH